MNPADMYKEELATIGSIPGVLYGDMQSDDKPKHCEGFGAAYARFPWRKTKGGVDISELKTDKYNYVGQTLVDDEESFVMDTSAVWLFNENEFPSVGHMLTEFGLDIDAIIGATWESKTYQRTLKKALERFGAEALGYFLPWHCSPQGKKDPWGVHLNIGPIVAYGKVLADELPKAGISLPSKTEYAQLSMELVLRHELFHFRVERFAITQEVIQRRPVFRPYARNVYRKMARTPLWLEEALAEASVLGSLEKRPIQEFDGKALRNALIPLFKQRGPGYGDFECVVCGGPSFAHKMLGAQLVSGQSLPDFYLTDVAWPESQSLDCPASPRPPVYMEFLKKGGSQFQLSLPKRIKTERFLAKCGYKIDKRFGVGDHYVYKNEFGDKVTINFKHGVLDIASAKALARLVEMNLYDTLRQMAIC